jgi:diguanylate cyclase (GGDEF)-like protein/PAS domain S-box-containing protein
MPRQLFNKIILGFGGTIAVLGVACTISYNSLKKVAASQQELVETQEVHHHIQVILFQVKNLDIEQRNYLITKKPTFLEAYNTLDGEIKQKIYGLENLPEIFPNQQLWLDVLEQALKEHLAISKMIIEQESKAILEAIPEKVPPTENKQDTDRLYQISFDMESIMEQALTEQSLKTQTILQRSFFSFTLAMFLSAWILAILYSLISRELKLLKKIEHTLQERLNVVEATIDGIALLDENGEYIYLNQSHLKLFGYRNSQELLGKSWQELYYPEEIKRFESEVFPMLQQKKSWQGEACGKRKDGSKITEEVSLTLTEDHKLICVCRDVSENKKYQALLDETNAKLLVKVNELEEYNQEILLITEIKEILQACLTIDEAKSAEPILLQRLFPQMSGQIFLYDSDNNLLEATASWNEETGENLNYFTTQDCWGLRSSKAYYSTHSQAGLRCKHLHSNLHSDSNPDSNSNSSSAESICIPMMAQGEVMGLLTLNSTELGQLTPNKQKLAETIATNFALTIANLKLRARLEEESIRDRLTGLFNRRYMEESLQREIYKCERKQELLSIIMLDVDHFKKFNDSFGHLAGDALLRELGSFLQTNIRASDIACRYGGEELIIIMPETPLQFAQQRGEEIREKVKNIELKHEPVIDSRISLSLGVACFPLHGLTPQEVIKAADTALYRAKKAGRDRVMVYSS